MDGVILLSENHGLIFSFTLFNANGNNYRRCNSYRSRTYKRIGLKACLCNISLFNLVCIILCAVGIGYASALICTACRVVNRQRTAASIRFDTFIFPPLSNVFIHNLTQ